MSYDFWKTGGFNPGLDPVEGVIYPDGITVTRLDDDEFAVFEHARIVARTFSTYGSAALFADAYRRAKRLLEKGQR